MTGAGYTPSSHESVCEGAVVPAAPVTSPVTAPNSRESSSRCEAEGSLVGVDWLSLSFAVGAFERQEESWSSFGLRSPGKPEEVRNRVVTEKVEGAHVRLAVFEVNATRQARGKVEFNPARVLDPDGWSLASPAEVGEALSLVLPVLHDYITPATDLDRWGLCRVDVARDFQNVTHGSQLVGGLASAPLPKPV